jgi:hypothetical protein
MTLDDGRRAVFARQAAARYAHGERAFKPVVLDGIQQYLALLRTRLDRHPIARGSRPPDALVADAAPKPKLSHPFTAKEARRIYTLMISDPERWHPILDGVIMPAYSAMLGPITAAALADPTLANAIQAWRSQWLADRRQILVHIPDAITAQLRTTLDSLAADEGTDVWAAADEVDKVLADGYQSWAGRAELIARTETVAANNQGALASWSAMADAANVTATKTWLATPDGRTRPEHAEANGQTVGINDTFTVMGEDITGPGDGSAANVCNCRCTLTFDIPTDAPPEVAEQASELEDQLVAAGHAAPSATVYFLEDFAVDAAADTAPVATTDDSAPTGVCVMAMLSAPDAAKLAQPGGEQPEDLHVTLGYLKDPAADYSDDVKQSLSEALASAWTGPVRADVFATALFNANDPEREPCSVVLVQSDALAECHGGITDAIGGLASTTFPVWIPHTALAYNSATPLPDSLSGQSVTYDRLVLAWGPDQIDLTEQALTAASEAPVTTPTAPPAPPANDGSATGGDTPAPAAPDLTPVGQTWSGPLAMLSTPSSDHRVIKSGGGTIRPLPLPLSWQKNSDDEHDGSVIVGRILSVEDRGDVLWGTGDYMDPMLNFDAEQAMAQVDAGLGMISVDLAPTSVGFEDEAGNPIDPALYDGDPDGCNLVAVEWEFGGATIVSFQAFADARIVNDPSTEPQPADSMLMPPMPEQFAAATPEAPTIAEDGSSITLQDGSTVTVGDTVGLGDTDGDGDDDTGTITAINPETDSIDAQVLPDGDDDADDDPANPVTVTVPITKLVPPPSVPTNKPGSDETPPAPPSAGAHALTFADEPISDKPWSDFPASDFNPDQWKRACIIHLDPAAGQDPNSKDLHKLPIREPDGTLNRNAVHAAAGRIASTDAPPDKIASAKASLRGAYDTLGEDVPDSIKAAVEGDADYALLASSYSEPYRAEFFAQQPLTGPTALRVDRETGQVSGHLAAFNTCHVAKLAETGMCVTVPEGDDFSLFHLGEVITDDGPVQVGKITMGGGHYGSGGVRGAVEHYDSTSSIAAPVRAYYDEYGIQVAGQLAHGIDPHKVDELMTAGQLSGDWRGRAPHRKLVAALAVNQGSFPVQRISPIVGLDAHGQQTSLVAAGVVYRDEPVRDVVLPSGARIASGDFEALVASMMESMNRGRPVPVPASQVDELALRRARARLRLHNLSAAQ